MNNSKGFTLLELLITSVIMVIITTAIFTFLIAGYSISNSSVAMSRAQNELMVIQERVYYTIRSAGALKTPDSKTLEIYNNDVTIKNPITVFKEENNSLIMLSGDGINYPTKESNISKNCEEIDWSFEIKSKEAIFNCSLKTKEGKDIYSIPKTDLIAYYRSTRAIAP